jgi:uncharacterized Ntn-hydrolase superfamily protein
MTFSIAARCPRTGMLGVATSSASLASGASVPSVRAGTGAIASQAFGNPFFGIDGLLLLADGLAPGQAVHELLAADPGGELRQLVIVDGQGRTAAFTGLECLRWAAHQSGHGYVVAGNRLAGQQVLVAMAEAFEQSVEHELPERLMRALESGQSAGGDRAGRQSAALFVAYDQDYSYYDLRVDDHSQPIAELRRIFELKRDSGQDLGNWRPTRDAPIEPGFLENWPQLKVELERESAAAEVDA